MDTTGERIERSWPRLLDSADADRDPSADRIGMDVRLLDAGWTASLNPNLRSGVPLHTLRIQYVAHAVLFLMLVIATFIDFDEQSIPDLVTTPATLLALLGSALLPQWHLIYETPDSVLVRLQPGSPMAWNTAWDGIGGMWLGLLSFSIWCFAIADRRWITRRGLGKAIEYFIAGIFRYPTWKILFAIWVIGSIAIVIGFRFLSNDQWRSLFCSLIGMTLGCSIVWAIRVVARAAMQVEAMGFGDVTLMAMVGAFLGWQPAWMAFFLAPMIAVLIVLILSLITGNGMTPFGPYLAMATMLVLVFWDFLFNQYVMPRMLMMGDYWIWFLFAFLLVFGVVLWIWAQIKSLLFRRG